MDGDGRKSGPGVIAKLVKKDPQVLGFGPLKRV